METTSSINPGEINLVECSVKPEDAIYGNLILQEVMHYDI